MADNEPLSARDLARILERHGRADVVVVLDGCAVPVTTAMVVNPAMLVPGTQSPVFLALVNEDEYADPQYGGNDKSTTYRIDDYIKTQFPVQLSEVEGA